MRIAVDAMGGDHGPAVIVPGAVLGGREFGVGVTLVGRTDEIQGVLESVDIGGVDVEIIDAPETITMDDHPARAARNKPRSSMVVALEAVKRGEAVGFVSAGNSGAVMAAALVILGRVPGLDRPAIASRLLPLPNASFVLDLGAVTDPRPHHLVQFAQMGSLYVERVLGVRNPTVGLLSNGEEPSKGNQLVREAFPLLAAAPGINFHGNVEGKDFTGGSVDIVVTDGFTGNIALKVAEGMGTLVGDVLREAVTASLPRRLAAVALRAAFRDVRAKLDYAETGGAPLLGIDGMVVIAHGRSNERAIQNAIGITKRGAEQDVIGTIRTLFAATAAESTSPDTSFPEAEPVAAPNAG